MFGIKKRKQAKVFDEKEEKALSIKKEFVEGRISNIDFWNIFLTKNRKKWVDHFWLYSLLSF